MVVAVRKREKEDSGDEEMKLYIVIQKGRMVKPRSGPWNCARETRINDQRLLVKFAVMRESSGTFRPDCYANLWVAKEKTFNDETRRILPGWIVRWYVESHFWWLVQKDQEEEETKSGSFSPSTLEGWWERGWINVACPSGECTRE